MKIGIYSEASRGTSSLGGSEAIVVTLAKLLQTAGHEVEIVHHSPDLSTTALAERFGFDPAALTLRYAELEPPPSATNFLTRHREEQDWHRALSQPYDLFINIAHWIPPRCRSKHGVLFVLFPLFDATRFWSDLYSQNLERSTLANAFRRWYHRWNWSKKMRSYDFKASISQYSQHWTVRYWGVNSRVVYPPSDDAREVGMDAKRDMIVSLGRFAGVGFSKKQLELAVAFRRLLSRLPSTWQYHAIGGLGPDEADHRYFASLQQMSCDGRFHASSDLGRAALRDQLAAAKIFWHAAGYGENQQERPQLSEHFGIATVEAMQAGCVPVVINRGAQPEIVQHGVNGFLWNTLDELVEFTCLLADNDALRSDLAAAAVERARGFSRERFERDFMNLVAPVLH